MVLSMKSRFIVGILVMALGLSGCGSFETTEVLAATATTTAVTFGMTTVAKATTKTTTAHETTIAQPTLFDVNHPVSYNDWGSIDRNTTELYINCVSQYDIDMLAEFNKLESLSISFGTSLDEDTEIPPPDNVDISIIKNMTELKSLSISSVNIIGDLTWLKNLTELTELRLSADDNNYVTFDFEIISDIHMLKELGFSNLYFENFDEISKLKILESLRFSSIKNADITAIKHLNALKDLKIWNSYTENDYSFIKNLNNIETLCISNISVDIDYSFLSPLEKLTDITIINSDITNCNFINYLNNPENITRLEMQHNQISSLEGVEKLSELRFLYIDNNKISDLSPLLPLDELAVVTLSDNPVSDLSPLNDMQNVDDYGNVLMISADNINMTEIEVWDYVYNSEFIRFGN
jgi:hypothetical protein